MNERKPSGLLRAGALLLAALMVFGNLYLPSGVFAVKAANSNWNTLSSPLTEDFTSHTEGTSGSFGVGTVSGSTPTNATATVVQNSAGNKMLAISNKDRSPHGFARMIFRQNASNYYTGTFRLSYYIAVANTEGRFYIPTLTRYKGGADGPVIYLAFNKGELEYQVNLSQRALPVTYVGESETVTYKANEWMLVEQTYTCGAAGEQQITMSINGKQLAVQASAQDLIAGVSMWMTNDMGSQVAYVDNFTVTMGDQEHVVMSAPEGGIDIPATSVKFVDADGQQIDSLTIEEKTSTMLNLAFEPFFASNTAVTMTSSNPTAADFDGEGKLICYNAGETTVTAKLNSNQAVTATLSVTVSAGAETTGNPMPIRDDFQSHTLDTSGDFVVLNPTGAYGVAEVCQNSAGNKLLAISHKKGTNVDGYATLNIEKTSNGTFKEPMYLSYWLATSSIDGRFYIPTFSQLNDNGSHNLAVYIAPLKDSNGNGIFQYATNMGGPWYTLTYADTTDEPVTYKPNEWLLIEQVYTSTNYSGTRIMTMSINSRPVNITYADRGYINSIDMVIRKDMGNKVCYVDNLTLTNVPHDAMAEPKGGFDISASSMSFVDADGQQISTLIIPTRTPTQLSIAFKPAVANATAADVSFTSSNPAVADFVDGKLVGYKTGEVTVTATLSSNSEITATLTVTVDASAEGLPIEENFTNVTEGTGGNFEVTGPDAADATVCVNSTGNKMLIVSNNGGSGHGYANLPFRNAAGETVSYGGTLYLSYWVSTSEQDLFYLPSLSKDNNQAAVVAFWNNGNFKYTTNYSNWTDVTYKNITDVGGNHQVATYRTNEWILIEQIYTCNSNGVYSMTMKINGEEVVLAPMDRSSLNCVSMRMPNGMGSQVAYVDNLTVTAYPHTAMPCPDSTNNFTIPTAGISFLGEDGQPTNALTVMSMNPTQLNLAFTPIYATDRAVTLVSSDKTVADFDASGKLIGFKAGQTTVTATLNSNPAITAQVVVTVDTSNQALPIVEDFQDKQEGSGGSFVVTGTEDAYGYVFAKNNGNKLFQVSNTNTLEHGYATLPFINKLGEQVSYNGTLYLSYWMAVDSKAVFYIPSFSSFTADNNLAAYITLKANGNFEYSTNRSTWKPVYYKESGNVATYGVNEWILIEQEYTCGNNPTFVMKINGEEVIAEAIGRSSVNCVSMYMTMWMKGQVAYIDNMTVSVVPHVPMPKPDENLVVGTAGVGFVDAAGQPISTLTIKAQTPTKLNVAFNPLGASDRDVIITSSNPEVADFDDNGKLVGFMGGDTVITVTLKSNSEITATLPVHVDVVDAQTVTITNVELKPDAEKPDTYNMVVGDHGFAAAQVLPAEADYQGVVWTSSNPSVATVDSFGEILALKDGTTVITATSAQPGSTVSASFTVNVTKPGVQKTISVASVAQLKSAMEEIADINADGGMTGNIVLEMADGYYYLTETLKFGPEHSGTNGYSVIIKAAGNATPVISGATVIEGQWNQVEGKDYYSIQVPKTVNSRQLFVNNIRGVRARSNVGLTNSQFIYDGSTNIGYVCEDVYLTSYKYVQDLELVFMEEWTQPRCGVTRIENNNNGTVNLIMDQPGWSGVGRTGQAVATKGGTSAKSYGPVWLENALELLDETGEWYLDTHTSEQYNILYYMPRPFENLETAVVTMPTLDNATDVEGCDGALVEISGTFTDSTHNYVATQVMNIHFEGITFADTTWMRPSTEKGHSDAQNNYLREGTSTNDKLMPGAVLVEGANGIWFTGCTFTRLGINGLQMINGVQNSLIVGNHFFDISGNAITIGEPDTDEVNAHAQGLNLIKNNDILNNFIHDIGVDFGSSAAISVGYAAEMDMSHNELFNLPYSGWHIGYGWGSVFHSNTKNMRVEYNFVHDIMGMGIYDGGAIYTIGNTSGEGYNTIYRNYIRNQMEATAALYSDVGSTYFEYIENVVDLSESGPWTTGQKWSFVGDSSKHIHFIDNFITTQTRGGRPADYEARYDIFCGEQNLDENANWNMGVGEQNITAQEIINEAGLESGYAGLRNGQVERIKLMADGAVYGGEERFLKTGDTVQLSFAVSALRDGEEITDGLNYHYYYESRNPAVAEVDQNGLVIAKSSGITAIRLLVISNNVVEVKEFDLLVNDVAGSVVLKEIDDVVSFTADAQGLQLTPVVTSTLGFERTPDSLAYGVSNKEIATVTEDGFLAPVAAGTTSLTVVATYGGVSVSAIYKVVIKEAAIIPEVNASDMFDKAQENTWSRSNAAQWSVVDGTSVSGKFNSYAIFGGKKYENELLSFKLKIDRTTGSKNWPSIVLRAKDSVGEAQTGDTDGYVFCMGNNGIEVYRFIDGVRYVIRGNQAHDGKTVIRLNGAKGMISPENFIYTNDIAEYDIKIGAIDAGAYVRLLLYVGENKVLDYLDSKVSGALTEPGYFGMIGRGETFTLTKNTTISDDAGSGGTGGDGSVDTVGKVAQVGNNTFDTLQQALAAAPKNGTVTMLADVDVDSLVLTNGVSLDLNGNDLDVDYLVAFTGSSIKDSAPGVGLIKTKNVKLPKNNGQMPVWDEEAEGYRLFDVVSYQRFDSQEADKFTLVGKPTLGTKVNDLFMAKADNGLTVKVRLCWTTAAGNEVEQVYAYKASDVATAYRLDDMILYLNVTGAGAYVNNLKAAFYIVSQTGVEWKPVGDTFVGQ